MKNSNLGDKLVFLGATIAGLAFVMFANPTGTDNIVAVVVIVGGLFGMLGAQASSGFLNLLEKGYIASQNPAAKESSTTQTKSL